MRCCSTLAAFPAIVYACDHDCDELVSTRRVAAHRKARGGDAPETDLPRSRSECFEAKRLAQPRIDLTAASSRLQFLNSWNTDHTSPTWTAV
jgi:hypothetical protein